MLLYCKLLTIGKQLPAFLHKVWGLNQCPQTCEASVLPQRDGGPQRVYHHQMNSLDIPHVTIVIYLFGILCRFQHCTGHITTCSWKGRGNQYIQFVRVLYCKLPTNGKQLPAFPLKAMPGTEPQLQRWKARVLPLCHHGPVTIIRNKHQPICTSILKE